MDKQVWNYEGLCINLVPSSYSLRKYCSGCGVSIWVKAEAINTAKAMDGKLVSWCGPCITREATKFFSTNSEGKFSVFGLNITDRRADAFCVSLN